MWKGEGEGEGDTRTLGTYLHFLENPLRVHPCLHTIEPGVICLQSTL